MVRLMSCVLLAMLGVATAHARTATARIERVSTAVATLEDVRVRLSWPEGATQGELRLQARHAIAPDLGYRFADLDWRCPLRRDARGGWRCAGTLRRASGAPLRLALDLGAAGTDAVLSRGDARIALQRRAATPELTRIDLVRVPLAWTQALLAQAWAEPRLARGQVDASLAIEARARAPLRITGPLRLRDAAFDTPDGTIAAEGLGARLALDLEFGERDRARVDGHVLGGELLFGSAYLALQQRTVAIAVDAFRVGTAGWQVPRFSWHDPGTLDASGSAAFSPDATLRSLEARLRSADLAPLRDAYLSGWLGGAGLGELELRGAADVELRLVDGALDAVALSLADAGADDPRGRFEFAGLDGDVRFSGGAPVDSELRWQGGSLYGLAFGPARLPLSSRGGTLQANQAITLPMLGGQARFENLRVRPPAAGQGLDVQFGLALQGLDVAQLAKTMGWPAFGGELSGRIPQAHYAGDRLTFDGGLAMQLFDGRVAVSSLAMERPFGTAPTLSADLSIDDLDLEALTGVFGFGAITGRLDGRISGLRLVDWQPVAFDARLATDRAAARRAHVRQRISQRAVQDLSSVGDASLVTSLQSRLIGLFDDFGYARIGIACRLADEVCTMDGLGSAGNGFIIVQGSGVPRLTVVGFNRRVDWPTLVDRLAAVGTGDVRPVVD